MARISSVLAVFAVSGALVGCGGAASTAGQNPATLAPAAAEGYAEVRVRLEGDLREDALAAAGKILDVADAGPRLRELVGEATDGDVDYARDLAPWLGERVAVWATGLEGRGDEFALIFSVRDQDAAAAAVKRGLFDVQPGEKVGVIDGFVVMAASAAYARMQKVADGGEDASLAALERYEMAIDPLPDDRLGHFYLDTSKLVKAAAAASRSSNAALLQGFLPKSLPAAAGALIADGDRVAIETRTAATGSKLLERLRGTGKTSPLVKELPADAWLAAGIADVGTTARETISSVAGGFGLAGLALSLKSQTGLDLEEDLLGWIGDVAVFVRGARLSSLDGAVIIEATDREKAANAFGKLAAVARTQGLEFRPTSVPGAESAFTVDLGEGQPGILARSADRVVLAYGARAAADALGAADKLGSTPLFAEAGQTLGDGLEPSGLVDVPKLIALIDAEAGDDADWSEVKAYLDAFSVFTFGSEPDNDGRSRFAAGF